MKAATIVSGLALVALGVSLLWAADDPPSAKQAAAGDGQAAGQMDRPDDRKALDALVEEFIKAYNAGDASAIAGLFSEQGQIIDEVGDATRGRAAIQDRFASTFETYPGSTIQIAVSSRRFLGSDVALEEGRATVRRGEGQAGGSGRYFVIYVKRDGRWLHDTVQEYPADEPSSSERLKELAWMVGDWITESDDSVVSTHCEWDENKNYLLRKFTANLQGREPLSGTQRIGWDPLTRQIKSWVFDSEGGYAEGLWTRNGDQWIVKLNGVLRDGRVASATDIITYVNPHTARWRSVDRIVGGEPMPDVDEFVLVRTPPKPRSKTEPEGDDRPASPPNSN